MSWLIGVRDYLWALLAAALLVFGVGEYIGKQHALKALADYRLEVAQATATQEAKAREREHELTHANEKIADELAQKEKRLAAATAAARRTDAGLRDEIARLNARTRPANPESAALADEARVARELLGACSQRYTSVAGDADQLRDQVTGLQAFAKQVCQSQE
jgi:hypothetical protein